MKTRFQFFVLLIFMISIISCQSNTKTDSKPDNSATSNTSGISTDLTSNKLPSDSAQIWIQRWQDNSTQYMSSNTIEYFDMPIVDLQSVALDSLAAKARYYLGLENKGSIEGLVPHLILLGLDSRNNPNFDAAYDYTNVCPPLCDAALK